MSCSCENESMNHEVFIAATSHVVGPRGVLAGIIWSHEVFTVATSHVVGPRSVLAGIIWSSS